MHARLILLLALLLGSPTDLPSGCQSCDPAVSSPIGDVVQISQICRCGGALCWVRSTVAGNAADGGRVLVTARVCAEPCPGACVVPESGPSR